MADELKAGKEDRKYFKSLEESAMQAYKLATKAREKGYDPADKPEVVLAKNLAERVIGLISVVAPQIQGTGAIKRIGELEKKYGVLDWRVAMQIAYEIAQQKFCRFESRKEAMEVGIRTGFAYVTVGAVSAPLEGFTKLEIKKTRDDKEYFCLYYAGPVRAAGGTASGVSVLIADYVRKKMGYAEYDPDEKEIARAHAELTDYHEWVTNLQYFPSKKEMDFLLARVPVEISGDPSEKYEISNVNLKDLPRVPTNVIRSGYCLVYSAGLPLKAPKLWAKLGNWMDEMDMEHWSFLEEFVKLQKQVKARESKKTEKKTGTKESKAEAKKDRPGADDHDTPLVKPDYTYISDLVAGRPVFGHPLASGAFRLRYGRSRASGFSAQSIHPATMHLSNDFIAIATQLKVERPGKAAAYTSCSTIGGPIIKLNDGSVIFADTEKKAKQYKSQVKEILYLGDVLVNYGDFFDRAHPLIPAGYVPEEWILELEQKAVELFGSLDLDKLSDMLDIDREKLEALFQKPLTTKISLPAACQISQRMNVPLHPQHIFYWKSITPLQLRQLIKALAEKARLDYEDKENSRLKIILPKGSAEVHGEGKPDLENQMLATAKRALETAGVPHQLINNEFSIIKGDIAEALLANLGFCMMSSPNKDSKPGKDAGNSEKTGAQATEELRKAMRKQLELADQELEKLTENQKNPVSDNTLPNLLSRHTLRIVNKLTEKNFMIRDKCGTFIGARMGRPEKAKMRKLTGSPHVLFPVGEEGGRFRSFQGALEKGHINAEFKLYYCKRCKKETVFRMCEYCGKPTEEMKYCKECGIVKDCPHEPVSYKKLTYDISKSFPSLLKKLGTRIFPDLIKGVRGTSNQEHTAEHLCKGILRAKHKLTVNKDGTIRYDCSEIPLTHFKPKEAQVEVNRLKKLGYKKDIHGRELVSDDQVLELKPQDILLPCCPASPEEPADEVLFRTACFIDEMLASFYGVEPYYKLKSKQDLVGQLAIGLAPHTSAGILCRIIGFSKAQGFIAHPYVHAAMRRDCDGDEGCILLLMDAFLNFSKKYLPTSRGSTMDAPLVLTYLLNPSEVDDMVFNMDIAWKYPLEFYKACAQGRMPWDVKVHMVSNVLGTEEQYSGMGFTHDTDDINKGVLCSAYKLLPSMDEKLQSQMNIAEKLRAVHTSDVASLVIDKHFMKDTKGNLRKFSQQEFRCVNCNEKFRRPPLSGKCSACNGKIIFTVSEGFVVKYLEMSKQLAEKYNVPVYMQQTIELLKQRVESVFGREKERQEALGAWLKT